MQVIKRDGREVDFDLSKIQNAIEKAIKATREEEELTDIEKSCVIDVIKSVKEKCNKLNRAINVEEIQDIIIDNLMYSGYETEDIALAYQKYRYERALLRKGNSIDGEIMSVVEGKNEEVIQENANKNPILLSTQRDYLAGIISKDIARRNLFSEDVIKAHDLGLIHQHDMDYVVHREFNCCLINLEDMLQNGTVISKTKIDKPHSFSVACNVACQIGSVIASNQYGGQTTSLSHLAPFVEISRQKFKKQVKEEFDSLNIKYDEEMINKAAELRVKEDIKRGVQTLQYQTITLMTSAGQSLFGSLFMYLGEVEEGPLRNDLALIIEEVLNQRIKGVKNSAGQYVSPTFPKLLYVLDENNITENSKYWYLTELAAKCTAKRMVPDYISAKMMRKYKDGNVFPCMGCRSFLSTGCKDEEGKEKFYGRFNCGVCTINLPHVALSSEKDLDKFWRILDERLLLVKKALIQKHHRLLGTTANYSPTHWMYGAISRLDSTDIIDKYLYAPYSTISVGYAGLWETVLYMTGKTLLDKEGREFGVKVLQYMNDKANEWKFETKIGFSIYGTPIESLTYKFAKAIQRDFGSDIKGITDKNYVVNSYHISPAQEVDAFTKLKIEGELQQYSLGGCISYVECPDMQKNISAVLEVIKHIYEYTMYAELNSKSDICMTCGYDGEIQMLEDENHKLYWQCPQCGETNLDKMNIVRRCTGYLSNNWANQGRMNDYKDRVLHL